MKHNVVLTLQYKLPTFSSTTTTLEVKSLLLQLQPVLLHRKLLIAVL